MMNPETNKFERLSEADLALEKKYNEAAFSQLLRPNGEPVPKTWTLFSEGENVAVKDYTFKIAHIGESYLVLEPVGPIIIGEKQTIKK